MILASMEEHSCFFSSSFIEHICRVSSELDEEMYGHRSKKKHASNTDSVAGGYVDRISVTGSRPVSSDVDCNAEKTVSVKHCKPLKSCIPSKHRRAQGNGGTCLAVFPRKGIDMEAFCEISIDNESLETEEVIHSYSEKSSCTNDVLDSDRNASVCSCSPDALFDGDFSLDASAVPVSHSDVMLSGIVPNRNFAMTENRKCNADEMNATACKTLGYSCDVASGGDIWKSDMLSMNVSGQNILLEDRPGAQRMELNEDPLFELGGLNASDSLLSDVSLHCSLLGENDEQSSDCCDAVREHLGEDTFLSNKSHCHGLEESTTVELFELPEFETKEILKSRPSDYLDKDYSSTDCAENNFFDQMNCALEAATDLTFNDDCSWHQASEMSLDKEPSVHHVCHSAERPETRHAVGRQRKKSVSDVFHWYQTHRKRTLSHSASCKSRSRRFRSRKPRVLKCRKTDVSATLPVKSRNVRNGKVQKRLLKQRKTCTGTRRQTSKERRNNIYEEWMPPVTRETSYSCLSSSFAGSTSSSLSLEAVDDDDIVDVVTVSDSLRDDYDVSSMSELIRHINTMHNYHSLRGRSSSRATCQDSSKFSINLLVSTKNAGKRNSSSGAGNGFCTKRATLNDMERQRRHEIARQLAALRQVVPNVKCNARAAKVVVLASAETHIRALEQQLDRNLTVLKAERSRYSQLKDQLRELRLGN